MYIFGLLLLLFRNIPGRACRQFMLFNQMFHSVAAIDTLRIYIPYVVCYRVLVFASLPFMKTLNYTCTCNKYSSYFTLNLMQAACLELSHQTMFICVTVIGEHQRNCTLCSVMLTLSLLSKYHDYRIIPF